MAFIEVYSPNSDKLFLINKKNIVFVEKIDLDNTKIHLIDGTIINTDDDFEDVKDKIIQ